MRLLHEKLDFHTKASENCTNWKVCEADWAQGRFSELFSNIMLYPYPFSPPQKGGFSRKKWAFSRLKKVALQRNRGADKSAPLPRL
jgi:hypothetical protein